MIDTAIIRLIAAAIAAVLLGYVCYIAAYTKHKNDIKDEMNKILLEGSDLTDEEKVRVEKTASWYFGYRLALIGLILAATALGWVASWAVGQEKELPMVMDCAVAVIGALAGGLILDKYVIHPAADGRFFEKVEDPLVEYFLQNGAFPVKEVKLSRKEKKALEKIEIPEKTEAPAAPETAPAEDLTSTEAVVLGMSFEEKVKLLDLIKKNL